MVLEVLLGGGHVVMEVNKVADMTVQMEVDKVAEMVTLIKIVWFIDVIDAIVIYGISIMEISVVGMTLAKSRSFPPWSNQELTSSWPTVPCTR